jgi:16S rRNA G527 N7-methylase RsmG
LSREYPGLDQALLELADACDGLGLAADPAALRRLRRWAELVAAWRNAARLTGLRTAAEIVTSLMVPAVYGLALAAVDGSTVAVDLGCGSGATGAAMAAVAGKGRWLLVDRSERKMVFCRYAVGRCRIAGLEVPAAGEAGLQGEATLIVLRGLPRSQATARAVRHVAGPDAAVLRWLASEGDAAGYASLRCGTTGLWVVRQRADCFT